MKKLEVGEKDLKTYIKENLNEKSRIALDTKIFPLLTINSLKEFLPNHEFIHDEKDLVKAIWKSCPEYVKDKVIYI